MAALGILVPSVQVRILVPQRKKDARLASFFALRHLVPLFIEGRTPQTPCVASLHRASHGGGDLLQR